jgi:hypothetical protein
MKKSVLLLCVSIFSTLFLLSCNRIAHSTEPDYNFTSNVSLEVTAPAYGENLKPGTTYIIRYNVPPEISRVTIALYRKSTFQFNIAENIENTGVVSWTIPENIFNSVHYRLKICDSNYPEIYHSYGQNFYIKTDW